MPAGKFEGSVAVELHRTKDMSDSTFIVHVKLVPNEDFPLAGFDRRYFALSVTHLFQDDRLCIASLAGFLTILEIFQSVGIVSF